MSDFIGFVPVTPGQAKAILNAMYAVSLADGNAASAADQAAITGAAVHVLSTQPPDLQDLQIIAPVQLASTLPGESLRRYALEMISVMAFIEGAIDTKKLDAVLAFASALGVDDDYVKDLSETAAQHISWLVADMNRENLQSVRGMDPNLPVPPQFLPYDANPDPQLAQRFHALGELDPKTFGRAFYDHYTVNKYAFPGEKGALSAYFALPHDSAHLLSGYSTSFQGEILVSTFTAAMHRSEGMGGHILPVIYSWHMGIQFNPVAVARHGHLDPEKFWRAWERGRAMEFDTFGPEFDFWALTGVPLQEVRDGYGIPPLDAAHEADGKPLPVRGWPA